MTPIAIALMNNQELSDGNPFHLTNLIMNNLLVSKNYAKKLIREHKNGNYVPSISFMFEHKGEYVGIDNSTQEFLTQKFKEEEDCVNWLEYKYSSRFRESNSNEPRLREWMTIGALQSADATSDFTKIKRSTRMVYYQGENRNARLVNCSYDNVHDTLTFTFKTTATFKAHEPGYEAKITDPHNNFKLMHNPSGKYTMMIQIVDFMKWLKGTRPEGLGQITWKELKEVFDVAYVKVFCNCGAFQYQTANYTLSELDASIYPTGIKPKKWNLIHGDYNCLCKHLSGLLASFAFFANQMASMANKSLKASGLI